MLDGRYDSLVTIAREPGRDARYINRLLALVYLAPDLKQAILDGSQPPEMTLQALTKTERLPVSFNEQRRRWRVDGTA